MSRVCWSTARWAGRTMHELLKHYGRELVGRKAKSTDRFPLLVKLIDAGDRLSLQVHPDEAACREIGGTAEPKTEMWYIIAARKGAQILAGLQGRATRQQLVSQLGSPDVENLLQVYPSQPGDAYFISSGTLHAIGGGNLILEIQQNSDTTYRVQRLGTGRRERQVAPASRRTRDAFDQLHEPDLAADCGSGRNRAANRKFDVDQHVPVLLGRGSAAGVEMER